MDENVADPFGAQPETDPADPFGKDLVKDKDGNAVTPSWYDRAKTTYMAHFYGDTSVGLTAALGEKAYNEALIMSGKLSAGNVNLTDAQIAEITNKAYPKAQGFGDYAADFAGTVAAGLSAPESYLLPEVKVAQLAGEYGGKVGGAVKSGLEALPGLAQRMINVGTGQMVVAGLSDPAIQAGRIQAGLQREFDPLEMGLAPLEGFAAGAVLHGAMEGAAAAGSAIYRKVAGTAQDQVRAAAQADLKDVEPGFKTPEDHAQAEAAATPPNAAAAGVAPPVEGAVSVMTPGDNYTQAVEFVRSEGFGSTSRLQRKLGLKHDAAVAMLDQMEQDGVLGPMNKNGRRPVIEAQAPGNDLAEGGATESKPAATAAEAPTEATAAATAEPAADTRSEGQAILQQLEQTPGMEGFAKGVKDRLAWNEPPTPEDVAHWREKVGERPAPANDASVNDNKEEMFKPSSMAHIKEEDIRAEQDALKPLSDNELLAVVREEGKAHQARLADENRKPGVYPSTPKYHAMHRELGARGLLQDSREYYAFINKPELVVDNAKTGVTGRSIAVEPGAEGKPQTLIEGVAPVTDKQKADLAASKPMKGKAAQQEAGGMFDEANTKQTDFFSTPYKPEVKASEPQSLLGFVRMMGGIKDFRGELRSQDLTRRYPGVVDNKKGVPLDRIREAAEEAGYLPEGSTPDDLIQALLSDEPVYSMRDHAQGEDFKFQQRAKQYDKSVREARQQMEALYGKDAPPQLLDDAAHRMVQEGYHDPADAFSDAVESYTGPWPEAKPVMLDEGIPFKMGKTSFPAQAVSAATAAKDDMVRSLQEQATDLAKLVGVPLRQGRTEKKAFGQFNRASGVARVREITDIETVAHEIGHALETKIGQDLLNIISRHEAELMSAFSQTSGSEGFAEFMSAYIVHKNFALNNAPQFAADFARFMSADHPDLIAKLDKASQDYFNYLNAPADVKLGATIVKMDKQGWWQDLKRYYKQTGLGQTVNSVFSGVYRAVADELNPINQATRVMARSIYEKSGALVDLKAAENPDVMMRMWFARAAQGAYQMMRYGVVPYGDVTPSGASLYDAISLAAGKPGLLTKWNENTLSDFSEYLIARRGILLHDRWQAGKLLRKPTALDKAQLQNTMRDLEARYPTFAQASDSVHDYTRNLLKRMWEGGLISKDVYKQLEQEQFYVPFYRDMSDKPMSGNPGGGMGAEGPGRTQIIRGIKGSQRDIIDPIQSLMQQTLLVERTLRHNDYIKSLINLAKRAGSPAGYLVEEVNPHDLTSKNFDLAKQIEKTAQDQGVSNLDIQSMMSTVLNTFNTNDRIDSVIFWKKPTSPRGEPIVFYKDAGQLKAVRLMNGKEGIALYEASLTLPNGANDIYTSILSQGANFVRGGTVMHPSFMIANYIRDQIATFGLRTDYVPFWDGAKGVWGEMTQDEAARLYAFVGGQSAGALINEPTARADIIDVASIANRSFAQQHFSAVTTAKEMLAKTARGDIKGAASEAGRLPKDLMHLLETAQATESGTRNSIFAKVYKQKLDMGLSPIEAALEAGFAGTDIMDFSRHGSHTFQLRQIIPFLNAHIQGIDKARRALLVPLWRQMKGDVLTLQEKHDVANAYAAWVKLGIMGSALGATWAAINSEKEAYRDADPRMKGTHFIVPLPGGKVLTIPKPFELALGFTAGEYAYERFANMDERAAGNFATAVRDTVLPPNILTDSPVIKAAYESQTGVDTFTGRPIVPRTLEGNSPDRQFNERTSPLAIHMANTMNGLNKSVGLDPSWSPVKVEHMFGSGFSTWGRDVMAAAHWWSDDDSAGPDNTPILRRFIKDLTKSGDAVQRFFKNAAMQTGDYDHAKKDYEDAVKQSNLSDADMLYKRADDSKKAYIVLSSGGDEDGKSVFKAEERRAHPIVRARNAVKALSDLTNELAAGNLTNTETGDKIDVPKELRHDIIDHLHQLGAQEMRNAMVMTDEPGYKGRKILDVKQEFGVIKSLSSDLADELARRYATANVYPTEAVAKAWPEMRRELLRSGTNADISGLVDDISVDGYEFGGDRQKRRNKPRAPIPGIEAGAQ